ncbi:hypothetical protein [Dactylosporangium sp. NPDC048998]|uniref:hypothetical protein n=1 Tax=Dactylosporangium sp. NPDC048998 TaxID=3363976 RepID=UPI00371CB414
MQTSDCAWRIEILQRGGIEWCRVVHGDAVVGGLDIAEAHRTLAAAGVDLTEIHPAA